MYQGRRVVVVTPAGRRRYLEILIRHVLRQRHVVDEYRLWVNTRDPDDLRCIEELVAAHPGFVTSDVDPTADGTIRSIHKFFRRCIDPDTLYVRLDDDVVWFEPDAIERLLEYRVAHPEPFLVFGNIVNNALVDWLHQREGGLYESSPDVGYSAMDPLGWQNPHFAQLKHLTFIENLARGRLDLYRFEPWVLKRFERCSINAIAWLGETMGAFGGVVHEEEEAWLSTAKPHSLGRAHANVVIGGPLFVHYAFGIQREHMDSTGILAFYAALAEEPSSVGPMLAELRFSLGHHVDALSLLSTGPQTATSTALLGSMVQRVIDAEPAERVVGLLSEWYERDTSQPDACYWLGYVARQIGDADSARALWQRALDGRPGFAAALEGLGLLAQG